MGWGEGGWEVKLGCDILTKECQQTCLRGGGSASSPQARHRRLKHSGRGGLETTHPDRMRELG